MPDGHPGNVPRQLQATLSANAIADWPVTVGEDAFERLGRANRGSLESGVDHIINRDDGRRRLSLPAMKTAFLPLAK
jgi:hypothetical protein